jgi:hypothetical protein
MITIDESRIWRVTNEEYHADITHDSHSSLKIFRESVPLYAALRVHRTISPEEPTPAKSFGSLAHVFLLEPEEFKRRYGVGPADCTRASKAWKEAEIAAEGKELLKPQDMARLRAIRKAILANSLGRKLIENDGLVEVSLRWTCPVTGIPLKVRLDVILRSGLILDLKTCTDVSPDGWARAVADYRYAHQAAMYMEGVRQGLGYALDFAFVAVDSGSSTEQPGTPHQCVVYSISERDIEVAAKQNYELRAELKDRRQREDWSPRLSGRVVETKTVPWTFQR